MSLNTSNDPKKWQELYTEKQARLDSMSKGAHMFVPIVFYAVVPLLFTILYLAYLFGSKADVVTSIVKSISLLVAIFFFFTIGFIYIFRSAGRFLQQFHNLSDETMTQLLRFRILAVPLLPPPLSSWIKFPVVKVQEDKLDPQNHWSAYIGGPVKLEITSGHALYLEHFGKFSRVVGQGSAFLHWDERIKSVINVGSKSETLEVSAWTKDGIRVTIHAKGEYFLGQTRNQEDENILIPFDPIAIRKAVEYTFKNSKEANEWLKSATGQTQGMLGGFISKNYLDDLFLKENTQSSLLSMTNIEELVKNINTKLQEYGACLSNFQITDVILPEKVNEQRRKTWEISHNNNIVITKSEVKAHQIRLQEKARAEMQRNLILTIANGLNRADSSNFPEPLLLSISGLLDQSMKDPQVRANLAKEVLETLEKLQESMKFPLQMSGNDA